MTKALAIVGFADAVRATGRQTPAINPDDVETESEAEDDDNSGGVAAGAIGHDTCRNTNDLPTPRPGLSTSSDYQNGQPPAHAETVHTVSPETGPSLALFPAVAVGLRGGANHGADTDGTNSTPIDDSAESENRESCACIKNVNSS